MNTTKIAIVDDHKLVSKAIEDMISVNPKYHVLYNCANGEEFIETLNKNKEEPHIVLMDINMPFKNGIETTEYLTKKHPNIKVIALTMEDNENTIIKMMRAGATGYLLKDMTALTLFEAIDTVRRYGVFYTDFINQKIMKIKSDENKVKILLDNLNDNELEFMKLSCTELTYKEIADVMTVSPKTVDNYRNNLFAKFDVKSRVGLVLFVIKNNLL